MKIEVKWSVNAKSGTKKIDLEEIGLSEKQWNEATEETKRYLMQEALDNEPEQPYMSVDSFDEM